MRLRDGCVLYSAEYVIYNWKRNVKLNTIENSIPRSNIELEKTYDSAKLFNHYFWWEHCIAPVRLDVKEAKIIGVSQYHIFWQESLHATNQSVYDNIPRNNLPLFKAKTSTRSKLQQKVQTLTNACRLYRKSSNKPPGGLLNFCEFALGAY